MNADAAGQPPMSNHETIRMFKKLIPRCVKRARHQNKLHLLYTLPAELVQAIIALLKPADLCSLRLTCKVFYQLTLHEFGCSCLKVVKTDLSFSSLQSLAVIAEHHRLRHYIRHLIIVEVDYTMMLGRGFHWNRHPSGHLFYPQPGGIEMLRDILARLANCESFQICRGYIIEELTYESYRLRPCDALTIILNVIANIGLPVTSFYVDFKSLNTGGNYVDERRLMLPDLRKTGFIAAWSHLRELSLELSIQTESVAEWAAELILHAPNLEKLCIDYDWGWEAELLTRRISSAALLSSLRQIELQLATTVNGEELLNFLRCARLSLRTLYFSSVYVGGGTGWESIFESLSREFPSLESIRLAIIGGRQVATFPALIDNPYANGSHGRKFIFAYKFIGGQYSVRRVGYTGPNMDVALLTLIKAIEYV